MPPVDPASNPFLLAAGSLALRVECSHAETHSALQARYQDFISSTGHADLRLSLTVTTEHLPPASAGAQINPAGTRLAFTYPGFEGEIDLERGEGRLRVSRPDPLADIQLFLSLALNAVALQHGGFVAHAAGIAHRGQGFLCLGPSGTGKTTLARLSTGDVVLNDDLALVMPAGEGWVVYGTPFSNPHQNPPHHASAPLCAVLRLRQSPHHRLEPLAPAAALAELVSSVALLSTLPPLAPRVLEIASRLLEQVPCFNLHFRKDAGFWRVIEEQFGLA